MCIFFLQVVPILHMCVNYWIFDFLFNSSRSILLPSRKFSPLPRLAQTILSVENQFFVDYSVGGTLTQCVNMTRGCPAWETKYLRT